MFWAFIQILLEFSSKVPIFGIYYVAYLKQWQQKIRTNVARKPEEADYSCDLAVNRR
jgi:hypothetical protein